MKQEPGFEDLPYASKQRMACTLTLQPRDCDYDAMHRVRGDVLSTLLDSVMTQSVRTSLPPGMGYVPHEIKVQFLNPVLEDAGELTAEGQIVSCSSRLATAEGKITDSHGYLYATASATCLVVNSKTHS